MARRSKKWLVWDSQGKFLRAFLIEKYAREAMPQGGSITYGYIPKPSALAYAAEII
jgi:hypothetical protein